MYTKSGGKVEQPKRGNMPLQNKRGELYGNPGGKESGSDSGRSYGPKGTTGNPAKDGFTKEDMGGGKY